MANLRSIVFVAAALFSLPLAAHATPLDIRSVSFTDQGDAVLFEATFDRAPDFETVDEYGRHFDAFQLTLAYDMENPYAFRDVWIEGADIAAGYIPVLPMQPDGFFGPATAIVPYQVTQSSAGHTLSFSVPYLALVQQNTTTTFAAFSVFSPEVSSFDPFHWFLDTFQYGESPNDTNHAQGQYPIGVPEPSSMIQLSIGIAVCLLALRARA